MRADSLLRAIWCGQVVARDDADSRRFLAAYAEFVSVPAILLYIDGAPHRPLVMSEDVDLEPSLPLGDVLAEELGLEVPYGALVVILPADRAGRCMSQDLGAAIGETLVIAANGCAMPAERQTDALYTMAHSAARLATDRAAARKGVDAPAFCRGLGQALGQCWNTGRAREADPFAAPDFLWRAELRDFLSRLDPGFRPPEALSIPGDLLRVSRSRIGLGDWIVRIEAALRPVLGHADTRTLSGNGIMSRFNLP